MTEIKGKYKVKKPGWGGPRTAGPGKKIGRPGNCIGTNLRSLSFRVDDETLAALDKISKNRSEALRRLAKNSLS